MNFVFESGSTHRRLTQKHTIYMAKKINKGRISTPQQHYTAGIVYERVTHNTGTFGRNVAWLSVDV